MPERADVAVIGAGAAGLATCIFLARARPDLRIVGLDGARKLGAKILVAGGGRCNVTNARVTPGDFYGGNRNVLKRTLQAFSAADARAFFEDLGVALHEEEHGKLFPNSNSARTVVAALLDECERRNIQLETGHRVTELKQDKDFEITTETSEGHRHWSARCVVLATGGLSLPKTGSDGSGYALARGFGHSITPTTPALDPLVLESDWHAALSGITHESHLEVAVHGTKPVRIQGSLLWTHFGISGPVALNSSRFINRARLEQRPFQLSMNLFDGASFENCERVLLEVARQEPRRAVLRLLRERLPQRIVEAIGVQTGIGPETTHAQLSRDARRTLVHLLTAWPLPVTRSRGYRYAEVTAGGVPLAEIESKTMQSRCCPGLFLVGEIVDVDARIGGFNFQWAWSSAHVAARAIAHELPH